MGRNQRFVALKAGDNKRVVKIAASRQLYHIPLLRPTAAHGTSVWSLSIGVGRKITRPHQIVIKKFHTRPSRRTVGFRDKIPSKGLGIIHRTRTCKKTLGNKVSAIAPTSRKIHKKRISVKCPTTGIGNGVLAIVTFGNDHWLTPFCIWIGFLIHSMCQKTKSYPKFL